MQHFLQPFRRHQTPLLWAFGAILGCLVYYLWHTVPPFWLLLIPFTLAIVTLAFFKYKALPLLHVLLAMNLFFIISALHAQYLVKNTLPSDAYAQRQWVVGKIENIDHYPNKSRVTIIQSKLYGTPHAHARLRISANGKRLTDKTVGQWLAMQVQLMPPNPPAFAADFDFRWYRFTQGLHGAGYVMGEIFATAPPLWAKPASVFEALSISLINTRQALAQKLSKYDASGVAAALITGLRSGVKEEIWQHYRAAGLAHVLAISGLHLGIVGGGIFFLLRFSAAFYPPLILRYNIKKIAAIIALITSFGYLLIGGASLPTARAFIMIALLFAAVLMQRFRMGLRVLAIAALIVLIIWPYSVVSASFQLSFTATLALILWSQQQAQHYQKVGYMQGLFAAGVIAGLATMPMVAAHFSMVSLAGFFINLAAIPLLGFAILPLGLISSLLPLPLAQPFLWLFAKSVGLQNMLAEWGAGSFLGGIHLPNFAWLILTGFSIVILSLLFMRKYYRATTVFMVMCSLIFVFPNHTPFHVFVLNKGAAIGLVTENNKVQLIKNNDVHASTLKRFYEHYMLTNIKTNSPLLPANCDAMGCSFLHLGTLIYLPENIITADDCAHSQLILSMNPPPNHLHNKGCPIVQINDAEATLIELRAKNSPKIEKYTPKNARTWQH